MTLCNMAIEGGARMGFVAVDDTTIEYLKDRPFSPKGDIWEQAVAYWRTLHSDAGALFDRTVTLRAEDIRPQVTWGTSPEMVVPVDAVVPDPARENDPVKREGMERSADARCRMRRSEAESALRPAECDRVHRAVTIDLRWRGGLATPVRRGRVHENLAAPGRFRRVEARR